MKPSNLNDGKKRESQRSYNCNSIAFVRKMTGYEGKHISFQTISVWFVACGSGNVSSAPPWVQTAVSFVELEDAY
jgi:hypothetical protein